MKKITLFISLLLIISCGQRQEQVNKNAFAENAERHLPIVVDVLYPNSKQEIDQKNTLYTDDSLHIESFVMKYTNPLGFNVKDTFQYIFGLHKDATYYYLLCPQKQRPLYSELMDLYNETKNQPQNQTADSLTQKRMLHGIASFYCKANNGGKLKE